MADSTRVVSSRSLARVESVQYIRAININLTLLDARPNTRMYVWFGDTDVTSRCAPSGSALGTPIITNSVGQASINLSIPGGTYSTGQYEILIADTNDLSKLSVNGSVFGSAKGTFTSSGKIEFFQETQTTINTVERVVQLVREAPPLPPIVRVPVVDPAPTPVQPPPQPYLDPIAQSFFTFGVPGGMFLTSIDLFFQTKDDTLPVSVELREMINGVPSNVRASNINYVSVLPPALVRTSSDGSLATKFEFNPPVYLKEDGEFCFVVRSNSSDYNMFTSKMGEPSFENGVKIFDNPYVGSLFKSENNITWSAEQTEDVKFVIRKAVFQSSGQVEFAAQVPPVIVPGNQFRTVSGSNVITYISGSEHGLEVGSKLHILSRTAGTFNGIPGSQLNGTHTVTSVVNRNIVKFEVTSNATSTGYLTNSDGITHVMIKNGGSGYTSSDTITFSGDGASAAGTLQVTQGVITGVTMTNVGSGYTTASASITTSTGSGAYLVPVTTPMFTVYQNKPMTAVSPNFSIYNFGNSKTVNTLSTTIGNYDGGSLVTYSPGRDYDIVDYNKYINLGQNSVIASTYNEDSIINDKSTLLNIALTTDNPNVSPVIDLQKTAELVAYSTKINDQPYDTLTSNNLYGTVTGTTALVGGSGYTATPVVTISPPDFSWGVQATATATRTGNAISGITITNAGSGYINPPIIKISRGFGDTTGTGATVQAVINDFNTELMSSGGLAKARYLTNKTTLRIVSTGVRLLSTISSVPGSSVDWYIRTSLSNSNIVHEDQQWQRLQCFVDRDKSSYVGEALEYEFGLDGIAEYDTYDLKCVLLAQDPTKAPIVTGYRLIVLA